MAQHSETGERPHAAVVFTVEGKEVRAESDGNGSVDASPKAINLCQERKWCCTRSTPSVALPVSGRSEVRLQNSAVWSMASVRPDIVVASAKAYLSAPTIAKQGGSGRCAGLKVLIIGYYLLIKVTQVFVLRDFYFSTLGNNFHLDQDASDSPISVPYANFWPMGAWQRP